MSDSEFSDTKTAMSGGASDDEDGFDDPAAGLPTLPGLEGTTAQTSATPSGVPPQPSVLPSQPPGLVISDDESDDDDDDDDDDSFQKFDAEAKERYLEATHPEVLSQNYDEIAALSRVVRDGNGAVVDELHRTVPWLTKYEKTRVLGQRIKQLNGGATPFVSTEPSMIDNAIIAQMELEQRKIPFILRRPLPGGGSEFWRLKDLAVIG